MASITLPQWRMPPFRLPDPQFARNAISGLRSANPHLLVPALISVPALMAGAAIEIFGDEDLGRGIVEVELVSPATAEAPPLDPEKIAESVLQLRPGSEEHAPKLEGVPAMGSHHGDTHAPATSHGEVPVAPHAEKPSSGKSHSPAHFTSSQALEPAPFAGLTQPGPGGLLPVISPTGQTVADAYARPLSNPDGKPSVSVIVRGLGLSASATELAITALPADVTLSFSAYAPDLQDWINRARADGHEVLLELPMEPFDFPRNDPGPHTLLADAAPGENRRRLEWLLARATGYFGVMNHLGARFVAADSAVGPLTGTLRDRGVALIYDGESPRARLADASASRQLPFAAARRSIDDTPTVDAMDRALLTLEAEAIAEGGALGIIRPTPVSVRTISEWIETLPAKGYALAPASAIINIDMAKPQHDGVAGELTDTGPRTFTTAQSTALSRGEEPQKDAKSAKKGGDHH